MKRYTFLAEYKGGTYISQYMATSIQQGLHMWVNGLDTQIFSPEDRSTLFMEIEDETGRPIPLKGIDNVWCSTYLSKDSFLLLNIVDTNLSNVSDGG